MFARLLLVCILSLASNQVGVLSDGDENPAVWYPDLSCHPYYSEQRFRRTEESKYPPLGLGGKYYKGRPKQCPSYQQGDPCLKLCTLMAWDDSGHRHLPRNHTINEEFIDHLLGISTRYEMGLLEFSLMRVMNDMSYTQILTQMIRNTCRPLPLGNLCEEKQSELVDCVEGFLNCSRLQGLWMMDGKFTDVTLNNRQLAESIKKKRYFNLSCHEGYKRSQKTYKQRPIGIEDQCVRYFKDENEMCIKGCIAWEMFQEVANLSSRESLAIYMPGFEQPNMKLANYIWNNCSGYYDKDIQPYTCPEKAEHWENFSNCISDVWACRQPANPKKQKKKKSKTNQPTGNKTNGGNDEGADKDQNFIWETTPTYDEHDG